MTNSTHRILGAATLAIIASAAASASAGAQAATPALDARWQAWAGCWTPVSQPGSPSEIGGSSTLCVVPAAGNSAVDVVTVVSGRVTGTTRIEADGQRHAVSRDGCTGTETAIWSTLGSRVFLTSELNCDGVARRSQSVMSFNQRYEWLDVQGITSGKNVGVAVTRYNPLPDATALPEELRVRVASRSAATNNAILAASAPLSLADIADVAIRVDSSLSTIWLAERTRDVKLSVTGKQLV
ncbi:MAG: hypothetical protein FJ202_06915, partial [Gemmatimonadetes bacterium]|nr:hypothetical protein [Gemmatimonadota bacterium]